MKILITGGTGFVGRNLVKLLLKESDCELLVLSRQKLTSDNPQLVYLSADIRDYDSVQKAVSNCDVIVHLAAQLGEWGDSKDFYSINIEGTKNIAKASKKHGIKKVIHISTDSVLNEGKPLRFASEKMAASKKAIGYYGRTKAIAEKVILNETASPTKVFVLRPRFVWGGDDSVLCKTFIDAVKSKRFLWFNKGEFLSSTCHVYNCCHAIKLMIFSDSDAGIYHVTDGEPQVFKNFISRWLSAYGVKTPKKSMSTQIAFVIARTVEAFYKLFKLKSLPPITTFAVASVGNEITLNDQKIRTNLGYQEVITFEDALAEIKALEKG